MTWLPPVFCFLATMAVLVPSGAFRFTDVMSCTAHTSSQHTTFTSPLSELFQSSGDLASYRAVREPARSEQDLRVAECSQASCQMYRLQCCRSSAFCSSQRYEQRLSHHCLLTQASSPSAGERPVSNRCLWLSVFALAHIAIYQIVLDPCRLLMNECMLARRLINRRCYFGAAGTATTLCSALSTPHVHSCAQAHQCRTGACKAACRRGHKCISKYSPLDYERRPQSYRQRLLLAAPISLLLLRMCTQPLCGLSLACRLLYVYALSLFVCSPAANSSSLLWM